MLDKSVRCDGCGAEAWVTVQLPMFDPDAWTGFDDPEGPHKVEPLTLSFCAHHYHKNNSLLETAGWEVVTDERELINVKPSVSANA